ncbi:MAG TPA: dioxygenase [Micromonosporaceae bacterium]|jgi:hydroxyquinol 1,2-dioxygenase
MTLLDEVIASFDGSASPRYREVMTALVRHLHAFVDEVSLTEDEWARAIEFLTRTAQISDGKRQEFVLLSDVLGVSMATVAANAPDSAGATESTVLGPFFVAGSPRFDLGDDISGGAAGQPCYVDGRVSGTSGEPIAGARLEIWQSDEDGFYDVQYEGGAVANRGHLFSDDDGAYRFWAVRPAPYPIPYDGPVGDLLTAAGRGPMRPAHIHFMVSAPGYHTVTTHIFVDGGDYLHNDAVFGVKDSLIYPFETQPPSGDIDGPWSSVHFDIVLAPSGDNHD